MKSLPFPKPVGKRMNRTALSFPGVDPTGLTSLAPRRGESGKDLCPTYPGSVLHIMRILHISQAKSLIFQMPGTVR